MTSPANGGSVPENTTVTISGTAVDAGDGLVGGVRSVDGRPGDVAAGDRPGELDLQLADGGGVDRVYPESRRGRQRKPGAAAERATTVTVGAVTDVIPPVIVERAPQLRAAAPVTSVVTVTFNEAMDPATIAATLELRDSSSALVPATVTNTAATRTATVEPIDGLVYSRTYGVRVRGSHGGVSDLAGNALASDAVWTFTTVDWPTTGPGGPVLVITSSANRFTEYFAEILRAEGLNAFNVVDIGAAHSGVARNAATTWPSSARSPRSAGPR